MGFFGCRGEHLKQLHQDGWQEVDHDLSLHRMQALEEEEEEEEEETRSDLHKHPISKILTIW